jgi:2-C-methyl-D-erythritol 2,4-cyclodiphosphate synthase
MRVGWGIDAHRFAPDGFVLLGGVIVDESRGVMATSDGDVAAHALTDAVLGAAALGDLGEFYPSSDPRWTDEDSMVILRDALARAAAAGFRPTSADVTVVAQSIRIAPHRDNIAPHSPPPWVSIQRARLRRRRLIRSASSEGTRASPLAVVVMEEVS